MIQSDRFIWLHFPKCAGVETGAVLQQLGSFQVDQDAEAWHDGVADRLAREPDFSADGRVVVCNIRRLPHWIISRVHYEYSRSGQLAARRMLRLGQYRQIDGSTGYADRAIVKYNTHPVDRWIRTENLIDDFGAAFGGLIDLPADLPSKFVRQHTAATPYIREVSFWFTRPELANLYAANPLWAALERRVYGDTLG